MKRRRFLKLNDAVKIYPTPAIGEVFARDGLVMALTIDKSTVGNERMSGLVRIITQRDGDENIPGYIDKSEIWHVESIDGGWRWEKTAKLNIAGMDHVINSLAAECGGELLGLEDPDIWVDDKGIKHVYFTIAFLLPPTEMRGTSTKIFLGHAEGETLDALQATKPVMRPLEGINNGFKEITVSPIASKGYRFKLTESNDEHFSVISTIKAHEGMDWEFDSIAMHPKTIGYDWCAEHASPCTILPPQFIRYEHFLVGIMNGRESSVDDIERGGKIYRKFRPGLFLFDPETGEIPWVSPEPLFEDPDADTITFASDFIQVNSKEGILYAHVNDSFVRAYKINKKGILDILKKKYKPEAQSVTIEV